MYVSFFFRFFSLIGYYKTLSIEECAISSIAHYNTNSLCYKFLFDNLFYIWKCVCVSPKVLIIPLSPFSHDDHKFVFCVCGSISLLYVLISLSLSFQLPHINNIIYLSISVWLTSLSMIISRTIFVAANCIFKRVR